MTIGNVVTRSQAGSIFWTQKNGCSWRVFSRLSSTHVNDYVEDAERDGAGEQKEGRHHQVDELVYVVNNEGAAIGRSVAGQRPEVDLHVGQGAGQRVAGKT
jgi:hypothetical protein